MNDSSEKTAPVEPPPSAPEPTAGGTTPAGVDVVHRDSGMLRLIGWFFLTFGVLLFAALFWKQDMHGRIVNLGAGIVLVVAGAVGCHAARVIRQSKK